MKTRILSSTIAALCTLLSPVIAEEKSSSSSSSSVVSNVDGTVTVTIDVNGKKETKTIKLGDGEPFTLKLQDGGTIAVGGAGGSAKAGQVKEKTTRLGVAMEPVREEVRAQLPLKTGEGLTVTHVMPDSPAAKAGIETLDIITRLEDQIVVSPDQVRALVKMHKPGEKVKVTLLRKGESRDMEVTLDEHEEAVGGDDVFRMFGGKELGDEWRARLKEMKQKFPGVVVEKRGWLLDPDGNLKRLDVGENLEDVLKTARKYLDESMLPEGAREKVRSAVEEAIRAAERAAREAESAAKSAGDAAQRAADAVKKKDADSKEIEKAAPPKPAEPGIEKKP